jgi:hypothetical protein
VPQRVQIISAVDFIALMNVTYASNLGKV